ncbi:MAG TPA: hypothetical protein IAB27_05315 [Candidatus Coprosoma intestinipullorum]|uniref:Uncharacterized protein n=1 Tax=Candidatus Coprosoma intestinipullorum TaxID=2840752 RepID=A0A9D1CYR8_9FIRM|nr:hypothetical protein [Candidatus Coprosoma intestinipullorum]
MLKIKDNVDLKELEKFGFEHQKLIYVKDVVRRCCNLRENKKIYIYEQSRLISIGIGLFSTDVELSIIYDLIQAGLVEKVEDK